MICSACADGNTSASVAATRELISFEQFNQLHSDDAAQIPKPTENSLQLEAKIGTNIFASQVKAIIWKNASLDWRQRKVNICTCCCILIVNAILALRASLILASSIRVVMSDCSTLFVEQSSYGSSTATCDVNSFIKKASSCDFDCKSNDAEFYDNALAFKKSLDGYEQNLAFMVDNDPTISRFRVWIGNSAVQGDQRFENLLESSLTGQIVNNATVIASTPAERFLSSTPNAPALFVPVPTSDLSSFMIQKQMELISKKTVSKGSCAGLVGQTPVVNVQSRTEFWNTLNNSYADLGISFKRLDTTSAINRLSYDLIMQPIRSKVSSFPPIFYSSDSSCIIAGMLKNPGAYQSLSSAYAKTLQKSISIISNAFLRKALGLEPLKRISKAISPSSFDSNNPVVRPEITGPAIAMISTTMPAFYDNAGQIILVSTVCILCIFLATMFMFPRQVGLWISERTLDLVEMIRIQGLCFSNNKIKRFQILDSKLFVWNDLQSNLWLFDIYYWNGCHPSL